MGTTTLHGYLNMHSNVKMSSLKEVHYFDNNYKKSLEWYKSYFPIKAKRSSFISGESTPFYLFHPAVPRRVVSVLPKVKIIIVLRNPVERAISHYKHEFRKGREVINSIEEAFAQENKRLNAIDKIDRDRYETFEYSAYSYLSRGKYKDQVERWIKEFGASSILVLNSANLLANPQRELNKVFNFLEIPKMEIIRHLNLNASTKTENTTNQRLLNQLTEYFQEDQVLLNSMLKDNNQWINYELQT